MYSKAKILPLIRKELEEGQCLGVALRKAGLKSANTLNLWRKPEGCRIDRYIKSCVSRSDNKRNDAVIDSLYKLATGGSVSGIAIWLKYKMGWKDDSMVDQSSHITVHIGKLDNEKLRSSRIPMGSV